MNLKIFTCCSFDGPIAEIFKKQPYIICGAGGFKSDFTEYSDNTGDNISEFNQFLNEMTLIYWVARNGMAAEYTGFAQYRRYLDFKTEDLAPDSIVCHAETQPDSIYGMYCRYHVKSDLDFFISSFLNMFPFYERQFEEYLMQTVQYKCNIFVMHKDNFDEYQKFICGCIALCIDMVPLLDLGKRDRYQKRALGFILERMTSFWIWIKSRVDSAKIVDAPIVELDVNSIYSRP